MITEVDVHRPADDLQWSVSGVHDDQSNAVRAFDRANLVDPGHHHVFESLAHVLHAFHDQPEVVEDHAQLVTRLSQLDELPKPGEGDFHENCSKNRVSFSMSARMSAISWRI